MECESLTITCRKQKKEAAYHQGDTILEAARRMGHRPPFSCEAGHCGSCMAKVTHGSVTMKTNDALTPEEVADGYILACQALPTSKHVTVVFE